MGDQQKKRQGLFQMTVCGEGRMAHTTEEPDPLVFPQESASEKENRSVTAPNWMPAGTRRSDGDPLETGMS